MAALRGHLGFGEELKLECTVDTARKLHEQSFGARVLDFVDYLQPAQEHVSSCFCLIFHFPVSQQLNEEGSITSILKVTFLLHRNYAAI